jgi:heavy-metal-associated domain-containing protein
LATTTIECAARAVSQMSSRAVLVRILQNHGVKFAFVVEQAGCESCGKLVSAALAPLGTVEAIEIDEAADTAVVVLAPAVERNQSAVDEVLAAASSGAGHLYRVRPGSWRRL